MEGGKTNPVEAALTLLFAAESVGWSPELEVAKLGSALNVEVGAEGVLGGGVAARAPVVLDVEETEKTDLSRNKAEERGFMFGDSRGGGGDGGGAR